MIESSPKKIESTLTTGVWICRGPLGDANGNGTLQRKMRFNMPEILFEAVDNGLGLDPACPGCGTADADVVAGLDRPDVVGG
jgi:hypothetical protein